MVRKNLTIFHLSAASPLGAKLIYYTSPPFNLRLLLPSPPPQGVSAAASLLSKATVVASSSPSLPLDLLVFLNSFVKPTS